MRRFMVAAALICGIALACVARGEQARDFPPGLFTDNGQYKVSDFQGKVVVLYFGCPVCPTNRASIPGRNKVVEQFRDKPVKFLAITPAPMNEAREYTNGTHLEMPCFADALGVMQHRYGTNISLKNIYQVRVIGPQGNILGYEMTPEAIEAAIKDVKWKYKDDGYDPKLAGIVDLLEWNQFERALPTLRPILKQKNKTGESARALYEKVKSTIGAQWAQEAEKAMADDKARALELDARLAACFPDDELGKKAAESIKALRADKAVKDELGARLMYARLYNAMSRAMPNQKAQVLGYCNSISQRYPDAPTGKSAAELAQELEESTVAE